MSEIRSSFRVERGGSWVSSASGTRSSSRYWDGAGFRCDYLGFRVKRRLR